MALVDITPVMTGDSSPSPFIVNATSIYSRGFEAYRAFDSTAINGEADYGWVTYSSKNVGEWIQIYLGDAKISQVDLYPYIQTVCGVTEVMISYSSNGTDYIEMAPVKLKVDASNHNKATIKFNSTIECSYIKITIKDVVLPTSYCGFNKIKLFYDKEIPIKAPVSIHKTLKANLPTSVNKSKDEIHFTEDGGIYISNNKGEIIKCGNEEVIQTIEFSSNQW